MCGFVGCIHDTENTTNEQLLKKMNEIITHRGPDDEGYYIDPHVNFAFRRLSIIGLETGHQPLSYENERYWIIFNGEIFNYIELKEELIAQGYTFRTESDTEVTIALYSAMKNEAVNIIQTSQTGNLINQQEVLRLLEEHCTNKADNSRKIWTILIFMIWHQIYV